MAGDILELILSFPTVLFTVPLALSVLYWLFVIVGAADVDVLGGADGALEGAAEGAVEGAAEGVVEGAAEGAAEGAVEAAEGGDLPDVSGVKWLFSVLKLRSAPATVVLSLFFLIGWVVSGVAMSLLAGLPLPAWATGSLVLAGSGVAGLLGASVAVRPLAPLFEHVTHHGQKHLVGKTAVLRMKPIKKGSGQAEVDDGNTGLVIHVRWGGDYEFEKGDEALIIDYDDEQDEYVVEPMQKLLGTGSAEKVPAAAATIEQGARKE